MGYKERGKGARGGGNNFKKVLKSQGLLKSNFDSSIILQNFLHPNSKNGPQRAPKNFSFKFYIKILADLTKNKMKNLTLSLGFTLKSQKFSFMEEIACKGVPLEKF